jgi:hypothetical protein
MTLPQSCRSRNYVLRRFRPADAPLAASDRALCQGRAPGFTSLISLPAAISRRARSKGDLSRAVEAILAGAMP